MREITRTLLPQLLFAIALVAAKQQANADDTPVQPYGSLLRAIAGDTLERQHGIAVVGFSHVSLSAANHDIPTSQLPQGRGRNIQPQGGLIQDEGLNLQHVGLIACKGAGCPLGRPFAPTRNVHSRVGPLPNPVGDAIIVDWNVSALYGEDSVFWATKGFDDWNWSADDQHRLAITQWYLDIYLPIGAGASLLLGNWHSAIPAEIGYPFVPPNLFASRTYAFIAAPVKHLGALLEFRLPIDPAWGHASASLGLVSDWNSVNFTQGPGVMSGVRWRSPDMRTWIDLTTVYGNGEGDFGDVRVVDGIARPRGGGSQYLALSSTNAYLDRFEAYLVATHAVRANLDLVLEAVYGFQEGGDIAPLPFAITRDSSLYGANIGFRYRLANAWHAGARVEWFRDEHAANVLWSAVGAGGGTVYAATLNLSWQALPWILVRPELKWDSYDGSGNLFAPDRNGLARRDSQLLGVLNFEFRF
jgi:hypothetical protein